MFREDDREEEKKTEEVPADTDDLRNLLFGNGFRQGMNDARGGN